MLIPITINSSSPSNPKLPSGLAKISHNEVVLVELQGSLEVECNQPSERDGKLVGKLKIDDLMVNPKKKWCSQLFIFITGQTEPAHWAPSPRGNDRAAAKTICCYSSYRVFGKCGSRTWRRCYGPRFTYYCWSRWPSNEYRRLYLIELECNWHRQEENRVFKTTNASHGQAITRNLTSPTNSTRTETIRI